MRPAVLPFQEQGSAHCHAYSGHGAQFIRHVEPQQVGQEMCQVCAIRTFELPRDGLLR